MTFHEQAKKLLVAATKVFPIAGKGNHTIALSSDSTGVVLYTLVEHSVGGKLVRQFWSLGIDDSVDWSELEKELSDARNDILRRIEAASTLPSETTPPAADPQAG